MRELTFFTGNQTKLAHARYLAEGRQIRIKSFRQRTYHAGYVEPRLLSRDAILQASYKSAKAQLAKAGISEASHPFVLEDTSVSINALCTGDLEVPGVDIKYWMQDQTFDSLDVMLRASGNDRRATVRSDVLLHVPISLRAAWGVQEEFVVFTGLQRGSIVDAEHLFATNLLYPWLDNRSFNKWFVPEGTSAPLGALKIDLANTVDFRRRSFEALFKFLEERRYFSPSPSPLQLQLQLDAKPNVVLCGYTCAGKTTASQYLARRFGYLHIEASDFMYLSYYYRHGYSGPTAIGDFAESALAQKPTIAAEKIVEYMVNHLNEPIVISGFRAQQEIDLIETAMERHGKKLVKRLVSASEMCRFARLQARARPGDNIDLERFRARDLQQQRMGLDAISRALGTRSVVNEGSLSEYFENVDKLVGESAANEIDLRSSIAKLALIKDVGLQEAILIALLAVWENDEARRFFTTTEVSGQIAHTFPAIQPKHKDNVSRYFNQDFYVYYEISSAPKSGTRKYRLSNTGYGVAFSVLRTLLRS